MYKVALLFLVFFIYSVLGYICEIIFCTIYDKKIVVNRGFLLGPYLPIYGICCLLMISLLGRYSKDPVALFIMSMFLCAFIEYITSLIMEKIFKVRWWDYSEKKYNINGRVCLENAILFGFAGPLIIYMIHPVIMDVLYLISTNALIVLSIIVFIIFLADLVITVVTMCQLQIDKISFEKIDVTEEIKMKMKEILPKNRALVTRLLNAFPNIENINRKEFSEFKKYLEERRKEWENRKKRRAK